MKPKALTPPIRLMIRTSVFICDLPESRSGLRTLSTFPRTRRPTRASTIPLTSEPESASQIAAGAQTSVAPTRGRNARTNIMTPQSTAPLTPSRAKVMPPTRPCTAATAIVAVTLAETRSEVRAISRAFCSGPKGSTRRRARANEEASRRRKKRTASVMTSAKRKLATPLSSPPAWPATNSATRPTLAVIFAITSCSGGRNGARPRAHSQPLWNQPAAPPSVLELRLQVADRGSAPGHDGRPDEHDRDDQQHDRGQGQHERRARPPQAGQQAHADRVEADRQDHRPGDLDQERLDDAVRQPADQENGAVEHELGDALGFSLAGHGVS